ncbi:hypothetical protein HK405_008915, partial [Cladochytrium tenue]
PAVARNAGSPASGCGCSCIDQVAATNSVVVELAPPHPALPRHVYGSLAEVAKRLGIALVQAWVSPRTLDPRCAVAPPLLDELE